MTSMPASPDDTNVAPTDTGTPQTSGLATRLWRRELNDYPVTSRRMAYLAIVVLTTVVLYYALYVQYAVATSIILHFHMTYSYFVWVSVIGNAVGAFASLVAGLADRWGRANMVVYGLLIAALLSLLGLPNAPDKSTYLVLFAGLSFIEGIVLVATPALIRDFSPQLGRATAMGYWTMGPVIGSLVVTVVTSSTLSFAGWQDELRYSGWAGLAVFVLALVGLRELSPRLRDQIMVSLRDRALVEARAKGMNPRTATKAHWRQMLRLDVVGSATAVSLFLLLYFGAVGNLVVYFAATFAYSEQRTNGLANWYWAANAVALVGAGLLSDRLKVRKPFMIVGAIGSIVVTVLFALHATEPRTGYYTFAALFVAIGVLTGVTYAPWMASFTETVEKQNPAATATGLAVWGWIIRAVVAVSTAFVPVVVTSATPLVEHGAQVRAASVQAAPALSIIDAHPRLFAELDAYPPTAVPTALAAQAVREVGVDDLATVHKAQPQLALLKRYGSQVKSATADGPGQWRTWWLICAAGQVLFLPFIFVMAGRWSPRKARDEAVEHQRAVDRELAALAEKGD
ncbi:MFS transporter [Streptomyces gibsoniae]|uniref:MFS transporter n=1 Tax=Streptomyces gibsoniae TaxID=3075529 RepID=A0ABU2U1W2_9ACTN|nr:MFS transporter [Streptomyces sp. DSM 41699]MDT0467212.1 MFS transporter [Streptomyces sp. DSM 41699]